MSNKLCRQSLQTVYVKLLSLPSLYTNLDNLVCFRAACQSSDVHRRSWEEAQVDMDLLSSYQSCVTLMWEIHYLCGRMGPSVPV